MFKSIFRLVKELIRGPQNTRYINKNYYMASPPPYSKEDPFILGDIWFKLPEYKCHVWTKEKYWKELPNDPTNT